MSENPANLVCVKSKIPWFKDGCSYITYSDLNYDYVLDEDGNEFVIDQFGDCEFGVFDGGLVASFVLP
ncbi:hypothetical protein KGB38_gp72 [Salmonella phage vB_SenS_SB28]|uniref:Uncharacterized protein n=1 Tax=Salmonella phage vB_SenS_SB28 TaxID=2591136 RepID=A0A5J6TA24_9CAUD|nr:hypothetical protein KGB38_gp72 [Salmonella phage vB_SenS_SB28]QFG07813.1 hypothetical protein [Salmonella phage vB_SenS_SB28]